MPILWSKNKKITNMEELKNLTQEEAQYIIDVQPKYEFTTKQANDVVSILRKYLDANLPSCSTCSGNNMRSVKNKIIVLYRENKEFIDLIALGQTDMETIDEVIESVTSVEVTNEAQEPKNKRKRK